MFSKESKYGDMEATKSKLMDRLFKLEWGAHHPSCSYHNHHLVRPFGRPLCIGCTFMTLGIIVGALSIFLTNIRTTSPWTLWGAGVLLYFSALIQTKLTKHKMSKIVLRFILGVATASLLSAILLFSWDLGGIIIKIVLSVIFYVVFDQTLKFRSKRLDEPCRSCDQGTYPMCTHRFPEMETILEEIDSSEIEVEPHDQKLIPLLTALVSQFKGGEKQVLFDRDFPETSCEVPLDQN